MNEVKIVVENTNALKALNTVFDQKIVDYILGDWRYADTAQPVERITINGVLTFFVIFKTDAEISVKKC